MKKNFFKFLIAIMALTTTLGYAQTKTDTIRHLKKDGTVDKRYKSTSSQTTVKKSHSASTSSTKDTVKHVRKDGKLDMRYKSNNPNVGKKKTTTTTTTTTVPPKN
jgi:ribosomal protein L19E